MSTENSTKAQETGQVAGLLQRIVSCRTEVIGDCTLYLGDCSVILPQLPNFDLILTDPPYGIGESGGDKKRRGRYNAVVVHEDLGWDKKRPSGWLFGLIIEKSKSTVIWGGNYFADYLPPSMGWFYWDKKMGGDFSDGELAWTSERKAVRDFSKSPFAGLKGGHLRQHPTQKPVALMEWCLSQRGKDQKTVCDPFMGSGTTGVACVNRGLDFVGIEREEKYFDIACERIAKAIQTKPRLFDALPKPKQAEQLSLI